MKKYSFLFLFLLLFELFFAVTSCSVSRQVQQAASLAKCDFQIRSVENVFLAGIFVQHISTFSDLSIMDVGKLMTSLAGPDLPLSLQLNLAGRNPNDKPAGLDRIDWIIYIDDIQMTSGSLEKAFVIPPMGVTVIPVIVNVNLKQVLQGKSAEALINFALNLSGKSNTPTRFKIKIKPSILIGQTAVPYPGYITVRTDYSSQ